MNANAADPKWVKDERGRFYRFVDLDPENMGLEGTSGVYVLWHKGVRPAWVYVGRSRNLASTFHELAGDEDIMHHDVHGGLYVTWSLIRDQFQDSVVKYLLDVMKPKVPNPSPPDKKVEPMAVKIPS